MLNFILIRKINVTLRYIYSSRSFQFFNKISDRLLLFPPRRDRGRTSGQSHAIFHVSPSRSSFASINYRGNICLRTFTNRNFSTKPIDARRRKINMTKIVTRKNQCRQKGTNNPEQTHEREGNVPDCESV